MSCLEFHGRTTEILEHFHMPGNKLSRLSRTAFEAHGSLERWQTQAAVIVTRWDLSHPALSSRTPRTPRPPLNFGASVISSAADQGNVGSE